MNQSRESLLEALRKTLGEGNVLTAAADVEPFVQDWRGRYRGEVVCVAMPATAEEVSAVVIACGQAGVKLLPQGGNTGLVGAATPVNASLAEGNAPVLLSMRRMNRIRSVDAVGNTLVAEAGCVLANIQEAAQAVGRMYGVTLGAEGSCQIGGNISTNAGGTGVLKYGSTRDQVLGLEVVLPDGRIWNGLRALHKDNTGYALKHFFIGGEGTLGIVTAASLRLHPRPAVEAAAWLTLDTVDAAMETLARLQGIAGDRIQAFELINRAQLQTVIAQYPDLRPPNDTEAPYAVLLELCDTYARADLNELLESALGDLVDAGLLRDVAIAASHAQHESFWRIRHSVSDANRRAGMGLSTDVAVPVGSVARFIEQASRAVQAQYPQIRILAVGHLGDGNVHFIPMFDFSDWQAFPDQPAVASRVRSLVHDVAAALDGTFSAEHGVGHVLVPELERLRSPLELDLMRRVRAAWDPQGLMNPGKVFRD